MHKREWRLHYNLGGKAHIADYRRGKEALKTRCGLKIFHPEDNSITYIYLDAQFVCRADLICKTCLRLIRRDDALRRVNN